MMIGFADDTNILAFAKNHTSCCAILEEAFRTAANWAQARGMVFEPSKSELIHFTRGKPCEIPIHLEATPAPPFSLAPKTEGRFLGIWLDQKLSFTAHTKAIERKMETQLNALTRLAASTWGCSLIRAREIYIKVIRAAIAYKAAITHNPQRPKVANSLQLIQNKCLRKVLGAYKATPTRSLEVEAFCAPLPIYFNKRLADFERRLAASGMTQQLEEASRKIAATLRTRRRGRPRKQQVQYLGTNTAAWANQWLKGLQMRILKPLWKRNGKNYRNKIIRTDTSIV
jgi:hypothetical protein